MSDQDATLRLNLAAAGMLSMLQHLAQESTKLAQSVEGIGKESEKAEKKIHPMLQSGKKAWGEAKTAALDLGKQLVSVAGQAATLGGALSLGAGLREANSAVSHYKDIAFAIKMATGEAQSWQDVQKHVEETAEKWGRTNDEVARSYDHLLRELGSVEVAKKASNEVAKLATLGVGTSEQLTAVAKELSDKFGVAADDIGDAMGTIVSTNKLPEFAASMDHMGVVARSLGLEGADGVRTLVGMLESAGPAAKDLNKAIAGLSGALEELSNPEKAKDIEKKLGLKLKLDDGSMRKDALEQVLKATGGQKEELSKIFSGDALKITAEYGRTYSQAFDASTGTFKERSEKAMDAFHEAIKNSVKDTGDLDAEAKKRVSEDPEADLRRAMNRFTGALAQPKLIDAVNKLADKAPALAEGFAKLIDLVVDNPLLAGTGFIAGKMGMSFAGSMASDGASALRDKAIGALKEKFFGKKEAAEAGEALAQAAGKSGAWKTVAGAAIGVAAAAAIAYAVKEAIDSSMAESEQRQNDAALGGGEAAAAAASGDLARMLKQRASLAERLKGFDEDRNSLGHLFERGLIRTFSDEDSTGDDKAAATTRRDLAELDAAIKKAQEQADSSDKVTKAQERLIASVDKAARAMDRIGSPSGGGGGTNGLPPAPGGV